MNFELIERNPLDAAMIAKAKWMADLMLSDGIKPEQLTEELIFAYMDSITRKINAMQSCYLTNAAYRNNMRDFVLESLN